MAGAFACMKAREQFMKSDQLPKNGVEKSASHAMTEHSHQGEAHEHEVEAHHQHHSCHGNRHPEAEVKPPTNAKYFCPMCPGVESDEPGACPKCGMALEKNPTWQPEQKTVYTCPMHPEVEQDHPGDCPKCGMALEPKTPAADDATEEDAELRT